MMGKGNSEDKKKIMEEIDSREMLVISLGTGKVKNDEKYSAAQASKWGLFDWVLEDVFNWIFYHGATPMVDIVGDASADMVDYHISMLFQIWNNKQNYLRIQDDTLTEDVASVDIATEENLKRLEEIGEALLKKPVSRVNLETGKFKEVEGGGTNEEALAKFAKMLHEERKLRLGLST